MQGSIIDALTKSSLEKKYDELQQEHKKVKDEYNLLRELVYDFVFTVQSADALNTNYYEREFKDFLKRTSENEMG